eukprot:1841275-Rhodomonas_salina.2
MKCPFSGMTTQAAATISKDLEEARSQETRSQGGASSNREDPVMLSSIGGSMRKTSSSKGSAARLSQGRSKAVTKTSMQSGSRGRTSNGGKSKQRQKKRVATEIIYSSWEASTYAPVIRSDVWSAWLWSLKAGVVMRCPGVGSERGWVGCAWAGVDVGGGQGELAESVGATLDERGRRHLLRPPLCRHPRDPAHVQLGQGDPGDQICRSHPESESRARLLAWYWLASFRWPTAGRAMFCVADTCSFALGGAACCGGAEMLHAIVASVDSEANLYSKLRALAPMHVEKGVNVEHMPRMGAVRNLLRQAHTPTLLSPVQRGLCKCAEAAGSSECVSADGEVLDTILGPDFDQAARVRPTPAFPRPPCTPAPPPCRRHHRHSPTAPHSRAICPTKRGLHAASCAHSMTPDSIAARCRGSRQLQHADRDSRIFLCALASPQGQRRRADAAGNGEDRRRGSGCGRG